MFLVYVTGNYAMIDPPYPGHTGMMGPGGPGSRVPPPPSGLPGPWIRDVIIL